MPVPNKTLLRYLPITSLYSFVVKWTLISAVVGCLAGSASALFLVLLDTFTFFRESHVWIIALLPLAGAMVGFIYYYLGKGVESGNNLLIDSIHSPAGIIPFKMGPLVLFGTLVTHLFGGSAGREGTAVQMGASMADQLSTFVKFTPHERKLLIIAGVSAGFASVFGTPLAGTVFGLEVILIGTLRYDALFPACIAALVADYVTQQVWGVGHTSYDVAAVPVMSVEHFLYTCLAGALFGLAGQLFAHMSHYVAKKFEIGISYPPLRPIVGGIVLLAIYFVLVPWLPMTRYLGLGVPTIVEAFVHPSAPYDFAFKIMFTVLTLSCGFKGGEVTPLFFIGATLGSALSWVLPMPTSLLAGLGFVAVFAGAANTPLACILMAIELFGSSCGLYALIACVMAYLFSGHAGIYGAQIVGHGKYKQGKDEGKSLQVLRKEREHADDE